MQTKPECRRSERFGHEYIIKLGEDLALSPYYAVCRNLSETGMYFKSLLELYPGAHVNIVINDYISNQNQVPARVVWCKKLKNTTMFRYGVGVEFLKPQTNPALKASLPIVPRMRTPGKKEGGVVIQMSKRSPG
jgi:Tfp pilus assembly protein PilZ